MTATESVKTLNKRQKKVNFVTYLKKEYHFFLNIN